MDLAHLLRQPVAPGALAVSFGCIAALVATQLLWYCRHNVRFATRVGYAILVGQAVLAYLPLLLLDQAWVATSAFLAGSVLLVLPHAVAWGAFLFIVASIGLAQWRSTGEPIDLLLTSISTAAIGIIVYGLSRLTVFVQRIEESRAESVRVAVQRERLRFARDLHDLLGYSLSAISHKIELAHRLMETSPQEARDELLEVLEISGVAFSDVRTVVSGYRELSLEQECRSVLSVLSAANIQVQLDIEHVDIPVKVDTMLATVLREGVTNLLRHSKAKNCQILVGQTNDRAWIEIVNDNPVGQLGKQDHRAGHGGLPNLTARAAEIGGSVAVDHQPDLFRLRAEVPLQVGRGVTASSGPAGSEPASLAGDPNGIHPVAGGEFVDDRRQIVSDGSY